MNRFKVEVLVVPRPGLLDPQGKAVHHALSSLGWSSVKDVRVGKAIHLDVMAETAEGAAEGAEEMCRKLLANPVTEDFVVASVTPDGEQSSNERDSGERRDPSELPAASKLPAASSEERDRV